MRVGRAFAFVDLSGFTSFTAHHGDEEAGNVLTEFRRVIREVSSRRGVRVAKWQGDGAMFVGVEPTPLTEAVLEIEHRIDAITSPLRLRGGITWGHVILFEGDDYIGSAVNLAARLCDSAAPHEILAAVELQPFVPPWADAEPAGPIVIRGFVEPVPILRLSRLACTDGVDGVKDPICGLVIPLAAVVARREDACFCSESCAMAWDDAKRAQRAPAAGPVPTP
ncbi:MAG TPA: adenylate/guanylate cyclase domain-containing protein [Acidimicrobiales bacterium]|nr:adenylate/guanylate cyclase domain-containing protein [Acidimicrobiales bacterium]